MTKENIFETNISLGKAFIHLLKKQRGVKKDIAQSLCGRDRDLSGLREQRPLLKYIRFPLIHRQIHPTLGLQRSPLCQAQGLAPAGAPPWVEKVVKLLLDYGQQQGYQGTALSSSRPAKGRARLSTKKPLGKLPELHLAPLVSARVILRAPRGPGPAPRPHWETRSRTSAQACHVSCSQLLGQRGGCSALKPASVPCACRKAGVVPVAPWPNSFGARGAPGVKQGLRRIRSAGVGAAKAWWAT